MELSKLEKELAILTDKIVKAREATWSMSNEADWDGNRYGKSLDDVISEFIPESNSFLYVAMSLIMEKTDCSDILEALEETLSST